MRRTIYVYRLTKGKRDYGVDNDLKRPKKMEHKHQSERFTHENDLFPMPRLRRQRYINFKCLNFG